MWRWLLALAACGGNDGTHHVDVSCANAIVYLDRFGGAYDHSAADDATLNVGIVFDGPRTLGRFRATTSHGAISPRVSAPHSPGSTSS